MQFFFQNQFSTFPFVDVPLQVIPPSQAIMVCGTPRQPWNGSVITSTRSTGIRTRWRSSGNRPEVASSVTRSYPPTPTDCSRMRSPSAGLPRARSAHHNNRYGPPGWSPTLPTAPHKARKTSGRAWATSDLTRWISGESSSTSCMKIDLQAFSLSSTVISWPGRPEKVSNSEKVAIYFQFANTINLEYIPR